MTLTYSILFVSFRLVFKAEVCRSSRDKLSLHERQTGRHGFGLQTSRKCRYKYSKKWAPFCGERLLICTRIQSADS